MRDAVCVCDSPRVLRACLIIIINILPYFHQAPIDLASQSYLSLTSSIHKGKMYKFLPTRIIYKKHRLYLREKDIIAIMKV